MKSARQLQPGDAAPNLPLASIQGQTESLKSMWGKANATLLVFLRHLG
jgi:hypothetical protein